MKPITSLLGIIMAVLGSGISHADELAPGQAPPAFELIDQNGKTHSLGDYMGKWVVLYFYPKDDTPGCTKEACNFRDDITRLEKLDAQVLGISLDSAESHAKFAEKHGLPFPLLSDASGDVSRAYGTYFTLGFLKYARRHTFIINPEGRIAKIYREVDAATHSSEVINDIKGLQ